MTNVPSTSITNVTPNVNEADPNPSHVIGPNIVTVKLSGKSQYNLWRIQMECLLKSQHKVDFIKGAENGKGKRKVGDMAMEASDSLVKGWILGSLSEEAATKAVNHLIHMKKIPDFTAKDLWDELQRSYGPSEKELSPRQAESKDKPTEEETKKEKKKRLIYGWIIKGYSYFMKEELGKLGLKPWDKLTNNGNTVLHVAVGSSTKNTIELLNDLLEMEKEYTLLDVVNSDGSSLLHVAAIGGNTEVVDIMVPRNPKLLLAKDNKGHTPLALSISSMHTKTSHCLYWHMEVYRCLLEEREKEYGVMTCKTFNIHEKEKKYGAEKEKKYGAHTGISREDIMTCKTLEGEVIMTCKTFEQQKEYDALCLLEQEKEYDALFTGKSGEDLVVLAISCQDFRLANMIIEDYPDAILSDSDAVLTALAQNFPRERHFWEPRSEDLQDWQDEYRMRRSYCTSYLLENLWNWPCGLAYLIFDYFLIGCYKLRGVYNSFIYVLASRGFVKDTFRVHKDAKGLLDEVASLAGFNSSSNHEYIFEATRRNSSTFIRCIMKPFPDAIWSVNEDGHNFIQYSVINRSEKIYNLLYEMSEHKNIYKTIKDSSGNNLLHLAARLAPTNKLNLIRGAALRIQRELQWFKEVERFVCPLNRMQKNLDDETPQEVFTREHKDLVIEGENWIKKTAESYTITAALIITIVFAAAITVPGGNNQDSGKPIFTNKIAFTVFAISNAISLFTAVTSLLMFLSILTARYAEQDFLFKLPTKLIIGLTMLFLSTTAMIIAFGATLFLMFGQGNPSMLIPISALTCLPITSFVTLQFPLIVDLISATYCGGFFVREKFVYLY